MKRKKNKINKKKASFLDKIRYYTTTVSLFLLNLNLFGFSLKQVCSPGFNCHGCAWATAACPIGVFAHGFSVRQIPYMAIGTILAVGTITGRLVCSFVCPFGLFQDLIYRIPFVKLKMPSGFRYLKYAALALLVVILPLVFGLKHSGFMKVVADKSALSPDGVAVTVENLGDNPVTDPVVELRYEPKVTTVEGKEAPAAAGGAVDNTQVALDVATTVTVDTKGVARGVDAKGFPTAKMVFKGVVVKPHSKLKLPVIEFPNRTKEAVVKMKVYSAGNANNIPLPEPRMQAYYCLHCPLGALTASLPKAISTAGDGDESGSFYSAVFFEWKFAVLLFFLILMLMVSRPFCQTFCPLGAIYGLCTPFSISRMHLDRSTCVDCGICDKVCPVDLDVRKQVGGAECIYCGNCSKICSRNSISRSFGFKNPAPVEPQG